MTSEQKTIIRGYQDRCNIPPDARDHFFEEVEPRNVEQSKYKDLLSQLEDGTSKTVLVCGTQGNGKTFIACSLLNSYLRKAIIEAKSIPCYVTQSELNMRFRSAMHENGTSEFQIFNKFTDYPLLVIDEIGRSKNSEYNLENLEAIISKRYAWKRPTILISNETAEQIRSLFDKHILDRLATGGTIEMHDKSMRR